MRVLIDSEFSMNTVWLSCKGLVLKIRGVSMESCAEKLAALRNQMRGASLDAYLIPLSDPHQSESVAAHFDRGAWLSGFTGSNYTIVVTHDGAWLWTDSRYFLQADSQLDPAHFSLGKLLAPGWADMHCFLANSMRDKIVAVDPEGLSVKRLDQLKGDLTAVGAEVRFLSTNLVDLVWKDRPPLIPREVLHWSSQYSGSDCEEKLRQVYSRLEGFFKVGRENSDGDFHYVETGLDAIAWLFNIRGADIPYSPLPYGYCVLSLVNRVWSARLFLYLDQVSAEVRQELLRAKVVLVAYESFHMHLRSLGGQAAFDYCRTCGAIRESLIAAGTACQDVSSPIFAQKSVKNAAEIDGMRAVHRTDGAAVVRFLCWLDSLSDFAEVDEVMLGDKLEMFRSADPDFRGPSFPTIAGYGPNGAVVHYRAQKGACRSIGPSEVLLIDSGGQYLGGTTDLTRTIHLGTPTQEERRVYTLVLRAHLALGDAVFPEGTSGAVIDMLARAPLWKEGLHYGHGTGHGVGCYLCVHESPPRIDYRGNHEGLVAGMVVSNEPGLYFEGAFGVRIENLVLVAKAQDLDRGGSFSYLRFEDLTLVPYCRSLIDIGMLSANELRAIDRYHERVLSEVGPLLTESEFFWLQKVCAPLC